MRDLAAEGRTILVSSHVLSEVAQTVDQVVIVHEGQLRFAGPVSELTRSGASLEVAFLRLTGVGPDVPEPVAAATSDGQPGSEPC